MPTFYPDLVNDINIYFLFDINYYRKVKLHLTLQENNETLKLLVFWREQTIPVSDKSVCVHIHVPVVMAIIDGLTT